MNKVITYVCPICGYQSDRDYEVCPACHNGDATRYPEKEINYNSVTLTDNSK